jgi:hypothetical protein
MQSLKTSLNTKIGCFILKKYNSINQLKKRLKSTYYITITTELNQI